MRPEDGLETVAVDDARAGNVEPRAADLIRDEAHRLVDQAAAAEARGDDQAALALLLAAIDRHPATEAAYARAGALYRKAGHANEADGILLEGMCWFPSAEGMFADYAAIAEDRGDWGSAVRRYRLACERFPWAVWTHARLATALRRAKRLFEAEQVLLEGARQVPHDAHFPLEHAEIAAERGDWSEAIHRFGIARERFPGFWWTFKRHADVLKQANRAAEAEAVLLEGQRALPTEPGLFFDHAELASDRQDWAEALHRFEMARERFPGEWWPSKRMADVLRVSGRIGEAEAVLLEAQDRHPHEAALPLDHAELAVAKRDLHEAMRRFGIVRDRFPTMWWPWRRMVQTLREMSCHDEAERVILEGIDRFPDEPALFFDHGELMQLQGRSAEALAIYRVIHERFPDGFWSCFALAQSLKDNCLHGEAEAMLVRTMEAFPDDPLPFIELVHLTNRIPADTRQVSLDALDGMVARWIERLGEAEGLLLARAQLAQARGDYRECLRRLIHLGQAYPGANFVDEKIADIREIMLGQGEVIPDDLGGDGAEAAAGADEALRARQDLLGRFESLGGGGPDGSAHYGCEFGFVQRLVKLEPLSLLRWTGVNLENVTRLLADDFAGVGEVETSMLTAFEGVYDWRFVDTAYGLYCDHTHLARLTVPREDALRMMCQRTAFLARKLREDLEDGDKIFVYRYSGEVGDEAGMLALAGAVNGHGSAVLFFVCRADEHNPPFTVRLVHPGLMIGHIDWFAVDRLGFPVNLDGWTVLCEQALRLWQDVRQAA